MAGQNNKFMGSVQEHERVWGTEEYPARPSLVDILGATVVAFWAPVKGRDKREMITLHSDLGPIKSYMLRLLLHSREALPERRLVRVFYQQKLASIKSIDIQFSVDDRA